MEYDGQTVPFRSIDVGGIPFQVTSVAGAANWLIHIALQDNVKKPAVRLANAYCVALASRVPRYKSLLVSSGINFPDGAPVVLTMRAIERFRSSPRRVRGPSLFRHVLSLGVEAKVRHFFVGSTEETLDSMTVAIERSYPGILVAGAYSPPFADVDEAYIAQLLSKAAGWDADVIWVGMGTPKQDFIAQAISARTGKLAIGVGAGFDFIAGTIREAPSWVQHIGLEWAYRFALEPRRLWRRYLFGNLQFIALALRQLSAGARVLPPRRGKSQ